MPYTIQHRAIVSGIGRQHSIGLTLMSFSRLIMTWYLFTYSSTYSYAVWSVCSISTTRDFKWLVALRLMSIRWHCKWLCNWSQQWVVANIRPDSILQGCHDSVSQCHFRCHRNGDAVAICPTQFCWTEKTLMMNWQWTEGRTDCHCWHRLTPSTAYCCLVILSKNNTIIIIIIIIIITIIITVNNTTSDNFTRNQHYALSLIHIWRCRRRG